MDNLEALNLLEECKNNVRIACERIINELELSKPEYDSIRFKFQHLKENRRQFVKKGALQAWETSEFMSQSSRKRKSLEGKEIRTPILNLQLKQLRIRLDPLLIDIRSTANLEQVSSKTIASLCLQLIANEEKDYRTSEVCKEIVERGTYGDYNCTLSERKSSFLLDFLSIGKLRYRELRRFFKAENIRITSYDKLAIFRHKIYLINEMRYFSKEIGSPVGIFLPYRLLVTQTLNELVEAERGLHNAEYPLTAKLTDGLDGSGSHTIYNQKQIPPDLTTKNFLLFSFKILWIKDSSGNILWRNPSPNSPFAMRPVALLALGESEENVKFLMDGTINSESKLLRSTGVKLTTGVFNIDITRCLFDTKMAAILDGAGGASCHLCTSTREQIKDVELVKHGYPINRFIQTAIQILQK